MPKLQGTSLGDYGVDTYERYHFTCAYCGFDGRAFDARMQLSIDHIMPRSSGGTETAGNEIVACRSCNSITSRMKFDKGTPPTEILKQKRDRVAERRKVFYEKWREFVAPRYLDRPLPPLPR